MIFDNLNSKKGFSIVSVLIAIGLAGGVSLLVMRLGDNMTNVTNKGKRDIDIQEMLTEIRMILEDEKNCRVSLKDEEFYKNKIDDPNTDDGHPVEIWISDISGTNRMKKKFSATDMNVSQYGSVTINNIRLFMNTGEGFNYPDGDHSDLGIIRVYFSYKVNKTIRSVFKDFMVRVHSNTNSGKSTITSCMRLNEKEKTYKALTRGTCTWSNWVNYFDQPVSYSCPAGSAIAGEISEHNNTAEDRRFKFRCCSVEKDSAPVEPRMCFTTHWVNEFDRHLYFTCPNGFIVTGIQSYHDGGTEDRRFKYTCCDFAQSNEESRWKKVVNSSGYVNNLDGDLSYSSPSNSFICGYESHHHGGVEDRQFAFSSCEIETKE